MAIDNVTARFQVKSGGAWKTLLPRTWTGQSGGRWDPKDTKPRDASKVRVLVVAVSGGGSCKVATEP